MASAEVLQEILHVISRRHGIETAQRIVRMFDRALHGAIEPVTREDVLRAAAIDTGAPLQARDRVHLAVMERQGVSHIVSADAAFDSFEGVTRLDPLAFAVWREAVFAAGT